MAVIDHDPEKNKEIKKRFIKSLRQIGWNVACDLDKECEDTLFDINMLLAAPNEAATGDVCKTKYGFLRIGYNDKLSLERYEEARLSAKQDDMPLYLDRLDSMLHPYDIDDLVCCLLHLNYHVEDFYVAQNNQVKLKLTTSIVKDLINDFTLKGSPLYDMSRAARPRKPKERGRSFLNQLSVKNPK